MRRREGTGGILAATTVALALSVPPALATEPLSCTDRNVLERVRDNLRNSGRNAEPPRSFSALSEPREVLLGAPPRSANRHATSVTFIVVSRYCEGRAGVGAGAPEPVYWRIDLVRDGTEESSRIDVCHKLFDPFEDGCLAYRPGA